jgi:cytidylate kinase/UDP-2,3-diacylglucosamine diphosphatase
VSALPEVALPAGARVIADLHLDPLARGPWQAFEGWLARLEAPALLVLGDLFEYWTGPGQARDPAYAPLLAALRARAQAGTELHFLHGNRDFLLDERFARAVAGRVHPHGLLGRVPGGGRVLFLHGDELATRDRSYQRLRRVLRSPLVRAVATATPAALSAATARALRRRSRSAVAAKSPAYVELQRDAAEAWCVRHAAGELVCGHAHRFRQEALPGGARWTVLDAFGGERDGLRVTAGGALAVEGSRSSSLQAASGSLSSSPSHLSPSHPSSRPKPHPMIIALDGPAGVGKSTLARRLARELGFFFLDTGAMYRAVTLAVQRQGLAPADGETCARVAREVRLDFDAEGHVRLDGRPGEPEIRSAAVTQAVSQVSAHAGVRAAVVARQRAIAAGQRGVVAEGRDTTTVVFPDATHKFYLDASVEERALRRARQENALERLAEIRADLERRDGLDSSREHSPLHAAADAVRVDTDGLDADAVVARILALVHGEVCGG